MAMDFTAFQIINTHKGDLPVIKEKSTNKILSEKEEPGDYLTAFLLKRVETTKLPLMWQNKKLVDLLVWILIFLIIAWMLLKKVMILYGLF
jgi:hypothetical protein